MTATAAWPGPSAVAMLGVTLLGVGAAAALLLLSPGSPEVRRARPRGAPRAAEDSSAGPGPVGWVEHRTNTCYLSAAVWLLAHLVVAAPSRTSSSGAAGLVLQAARGVARGHRLGGAQVRRLEEAIASEWGPAAFRAGAQADADELLRNVLLDSPNSPNSPDVRLGFMGPGGRDAEVLDGTWHGRSGARFLILTCQPPRAEVPDRLPAGKYRLLAAILRDGASDASDGHFRVVGRRHAAGGASWYLYDDLASAARELGRRLDGLPRAQAGGGYYVLLYESEVQSSGGFRVQSSGVSDRRVPVQGKHAL